MTKRMRENEWSVYMLRCADGCLYTGISNDVQARVAAHAAGKGAKYTNGRGPFVLVWQEVCGTRSSASRREAEIKRMSRAEKLRCVQ